jgi:endonuclease YncB( thermonuclease family)
MTLFPLSYSPENVKTADKPEWVSATDGDTPTLQTPIRMLGMDAPELHYKGATQNNPSKYDADMRKFLSNAGKTLDAGLKAHLKERLKNKPCTRHIEAGNAAFAHFDDMVKKRLHRVGKTGKTLTDRNIFIMVSNEVFDRYGRMLAYINAAYEKKERESIPPADRPTFNLQMVKEGHAATLLIYPNVPKREDLQLVQTAASDARTGGAGFWEDSERVLLAYEFRWIVDTILGARSGPDRYCADISTGELFSPQQYYRVLPENRLFFYETNFQDAVKMRFRLTM